MTTAIPTRFDGVTLSTGTFAPAVRLITEVAMNAGRSVGTGTIALAQSLVSGSFGDFALVPYASSTYVDPAFTHPTSAILRVGGNAASDPVNTWKRLSLTVTAPNAPYAPGPAGVIYGAFDYARIGVASSAMAVGETQQIAYVQFEKTPPGLDIETSQFGSNLFDLEQSSYEGREMYQPVGGGGETAHMTFTRSNEIVSCGDFSGKFVYQSPPPTNSYTAVKQFGTYPNLAAKRQTYADLKYRPFLPGEGPVGSGSGNVAGTLIPAPSSLTLQPLQAALVRVEPGVTYQAQVSVACETPGMQFRCAILRFDANFNLLGSFVAGSTVSAAGGFKWQQASATHTMDATAAWAAVVPRVTSGGATRVVFFVDEHRIWIPTTLATKAGVTSPARPWQPPRQLTVKLRATRVNYAKNPGFQNSLWGWVQDKDPNVTSTLTYVTGGGVVDNGAEFSVPTAPTITLLNGASPRTGVVTSTAQPSLVDRLKTATVYTASVYVRPIDSPVPITVWAHDGTNLIRGTSTPLADPAGSTTWHRLWVRFKTSATYGGSLRLHLGYAADDVARVYSGVTPGSNDDVWMLLEEAPAGQPVWSQSVPYTDGALVRHDGLLWQALVRNGPHPNVGPFTFRYDQLLVEEADKLDDYFDGNYPSADYMWEGAPGDSRSHYYRGKRLSQYRLDQLVQRQIGVGGSYRLVYASAP